MTRPKYRVVEDCDPQAIDTVEEFIDKVAASERRACIQELLDHGGVLFCDAARLLGRQGIKNAKIEVPDGL